MFTKNSLQTALLLCVLFSSLPVLSANSIDKTPPQIADSHLIDTDAEKSLSTVLDLKTKPRVALALGGGGCKCAAEIGVLRILAANKIPIDYIVGTSTGATIGAMYAAGLTVDEIQRLYVDDTVQKSMVPRMAAHIVLFPLAQLERDVTRKGYAGITSGVHFRKFLDKTLPAKFSDLKIPFSAVTTDLVSGHTCVFSKGDLPLAVQASNSLPPIYKPVMVDNKLLVDGALRANVPAKWARDAGADLVIAVDVDPLIKREDATKFLTIKSVLLRASDIGLAELDMREELEADILIRPETNGVNLMTGNKHLLEEAIKNGELAATEALPKIMSALQSRGIIQANLNVAPVAEIK